ncbi:hypothetical protein N825_37160 [Skermanella stibiiresistens SB22]|uniref:Uncharacterized protein n=1 Tax=Skermanella stibiiresistens SB22 TaxID=1385369 RepID=W9H6L5_9PROT|nr:tetratricopeptide repeat protein [Skermanella stibiiresistens]EWY40342.1 hypothetical protein N825_37160 [Skermanella stibiiresistens SB22]
MTRYNAPMTSPPALFRLALSRPAIFRGAVSALALATLVAALPASAAERKPAPHAAPDREAVERARQAASCLQMAEKTPKAAFESALTWQDRGGGDMARLCQAMALFHQGQFQASATRLEDLVPTLGKDTPEGASSLLARAGWAWLRAGDSDKAEKAYTAAIDRSPRDPELLVDRAFARAESERYWDAIEDLNRAIGMAPKRAEPYLYRAGAFRALGNDSKALEDVGVALALEPGNPEALLLRGNLRAVTGNPDGAKSDWRSVMRIDPDTTSAKAASDNLARLQGAEAEGKPPAK